MTLHSFKLAHWSQRTLRKVSPSALFFSFFFGVLAQADATFTAPLNTSEIWSAEIRESDASDSRSFRVQVQAIQSKAVDPQSEAETVLVLVADPTGFSQTVTSSAADDLPKLTPKKFVDRLKHWLMNHHRNFFSVQRGVVTSIIITASMVSHSGSVMEALPAGIGMGLLSGFLSRYNEEFQLWMKGMLKIKPKTLLRKIAEKLGWKKPSTVQWIETVAIDEVLKGSGKETRYAIDKAKEASRWAAMETTFMVLGETLGRMFGALPAAPLLETAGKIGAGIVMSMAGQGLWDQANATMTQIYKTENPDEARWIQAKSSLVASIASGAAVLIAGTKLSHHDSAAWITTLILGGSGLAAYVYSLVKERAFLKSAGRTLQVFLDLEESTCSALLTNVGSGPVTLTAH